MRSRFLKASLLFLLFSAMGCSLPEISKQATLADNFGTLKGKINVTSNQKGPVIVLRFWDENGVPVLHRSITASENGAYEFSAIPGKHYIAAYIDVNKDGQHQPEEHGNYYGAPSTIEVGDGQVVTVDTITISGPFPTPSTEIKPVDRTVAAWKNIGTVVTLDDPRFTLKNYTLGLWKPFDFLEEAEGGLFFLHAYQKNKVPVLFVHGVSGGPTLWTEFVKSLDQEHFQPWFLYYPSGLRLDMISDYLTEAVSRLQDEYQFKELYVVAHSMGGLVARSFVKKYLERDPHNSQILSLVITVNSPMGGISAASAGVKHSPIVVPSWRDVEPGSEFLQGLQSWTWPEEIPWHLVIAYLDGESDDGVVPLQSQAPPKLQSEATRIYIFNQEHTATLADEAFHATLNRILKNGR